jgi:hypothetical protein
MCTPYLVIASDLCEAISFCVVRIALSALSFGHDLVELVFRQRFAGEFHE